ncbi:MAG: UDP-N-acetylmuramoyl-tripeptide--D-alanyl-D-alanine ligase [Bacteroidales bacterium]|nr:UDP-N-acetylmuramoyl-tripeptide--D-alanyl-D-alanine ligase [Bacteroidales bacterium]MBN2819417.1 UDP-N-acetylmuramoyl-tripeptide--D-alanyl-D-alanine ligase [Bacteroidales bacterium]
MISGLYKRYIECNQQISTDSRNIIPGSIFFALKGENFNGNLFAEDALKKGAAYAVIDQAEYLNSNTILVPDVLKTLHQLARYHRTACGFKVFSLTGTNGKTTSKELIQRVLSKKYITVATAGNLNNHIGVPLTILKAKQNTEILVVEMGANHIGEIKELCEIALPDYGLITNIGKAHLEGFGGPEGVIKAKSELYSFLKENNKTIFVNKEDALLNSLLTEYNKVVPYGSIETNCYASNNSFDGKLHIELYLEGDKKWLSTQLFGVYNVINIVAAASVGLFFQVQIDDIITAIEEFTPQNNRSQILKTESNLLILDSYNANPSSMEVAISSLQSMNNPDKLLILGSMKELGEFSEAEHKKLVEKIIANELNCIFIGDEFKSLENQYPIEVYSDTDKLIHKLTEVKIKEKLILIKGSRYNKLERLIDFL